MKAFEVAVNYKFLIVGLFAITSLFFPFYYDIVILILAETVISFFSEEELKANSWPILFLAAIPVTLLAINTMELGLNPNILTVLMLFYILVKLTQWPILMSSALISKNYERLFFLTTVLYVFKCKSLFVDVHYLVFLPFLILATIQRNYKVLQIVAWIAFAQFHEMFWITFPILIMASLSSWKLKPIYLLVFLPTLLVDWTSVPVLAQSVFYTSVAILALAVTLDSQIEIDLPSGGSEVAAIITGFLVVVFIFINFSSFKVIDFSQPFLWLPLGVSVLLGGFGTFLFSRYQFSPRIAKADSIDLFMAAFPVDMPTDAVPPKQSSINISQKVTQLSKGSLLTGEVGQLLMWLLAATFTVLCGYWLGVR